jgi:hypothetical protein
LGQIGDRSVRRGAQSRAGHLLAAGGQVPGTDALSGACEAGGAGALALCHSGSGANAPSRNDARLKAR